MITVLYIFLFYYFAQFIVQLNIMRFNVFFLSSMKNCPSRRSALHSASLSTTELFISEHKRNIRQHKFQGSQLLRQIQCFNVFAKSTQGDAECISENDGENRTVIGRMVAEIYWKHFNIYPWPTG